MNDVEETEVKAETIDPPELMSGADRWLARAREKVADKAAEYGAPDVHDDESYKWAKRYRAGLRKDIAEIDGDRKRMTRETEDAVKRFREGCKDVLQPLTALDDAYKSALTEHEQAYIQQRDTEMAARYSSDYPDLAELVPWGTLDAKFGKEGRWHLWGTSDAKAWQSVSEACDRTMADVSTIRTAAQGDEEADATIADYCSTLDLSAALRNAVERRERLARVKAAEDERRRWEEEQRAAREAARAEQEALAAQPEPEYETPAEPQQHPVAQAEEVAEQTPTPIPATAEKASHRFSVFRVSIPVGSEPEFIRAMKGIPGSHGSKIGEE
jgi:hypothetical protein